MQEIFFTDFEASFTFYKAESEAVTQFEQIASFEELMLDSSFDRKISCETQSENEISDITSQPYASSSVSFLLQMFSPADDDSKELFSDCLSVSNGNDSSEAIKCKKIKKQVLERRPPSQPKGKNLPDLIKKELRKQAKKLKEHWTIARVVAPCPFKKLTLQSNAILDGSSVESLEDSPESELFPLE